MGLTVGTVLYRGVMGDLKYVHVPITWDSSYDSTGESLTPSDVGLQAIYWATDSGTRATLSSGDATVRAEFNPATNKLFAYGTAGAAQSDAALAELDSVDLSGVISYITFYGK